MLEVQYNCVNQFKTVYMHGYIHYCKHHSIVTHNNWAYICETFETGSDFRNKDMKFRHFVMNHSTKVMVLLMRKEDMSQAKNELFY